MDFSSSFGAEKIETGNIHHLIQSAPDMLTWAFPVMVFLVLAEYFAARRQQKTLYEYRETMGTLAVGVGNLLAGVGVKALFIYTLISIYNWVPWRMVMDWWTIIPCYLFYDFCGYWIHRLSHHQRIWWAVHVVHHSAEQYNLMVSWRLSWMEYAKTMLLLPVALAGFHPVIIFVSNQIGVLYQFWIHTSYVPKLCPLIEYVFVTPSHHRVHHGSQEKYINRNFGGTFIIWDRIFGTFQPEDEPVVYGITQGLTNKVNPLHINFHEFIDMLRDVKGEKKITRKLFFIFGDPVEIGKTKKKARKERIEPGL